MPALPPLIAVGMGTMFGLPEAVLIRARHSSFWISPATIALVPGIIGWAIGMASGPTALMAFV